MASASDFRPVGLLRRLAAELRTRADRVELEGVEIRVVALDDLLAMKRAAGRPQDLADVEALETARRLRDERLR